jgi:multidrug efflux pump
MAACWTGTLNARPAVYLMWILWCWPAAVPMFSMSEELAPTEDQGVIFGIVDASANSTLDQTSCYAAAANKVFLACPNPVHVSDHQPDSGVRRHGGQALEGAGTDPSSRSCPRSGRSLQGIPGIQMFPVTPPALPGGGQFPVEFIIASTAEQDQILSFAKQIQLKAMQSKMFAFPPLIDVKIDQPQTELVIDRDKVAAMGLNLATGRRRPGGHDGRQLRQPLQHRRPQLQGHPADPARGPPQSRPTENIHVTGPNGQLVPLSTVATLKDSPPWPARSTASSSSTRSRSAAWPSGPWTRPCAFWKTRRRRSCPRAMCSTTPASRASCGWRATAFLTRLGLAVVLIFLVLAAQFNSFRDPFVILAGSVPLAMFGA